MRIGIVFFAFCSMTFLGCGDNSCIIKQQASGRFKVCRVDAKTDHYSYEEYFPNGKIRKKYQLVNKEYDGKVVEYYPDGQLRYLCNYASGMHQGICNEYDSLGRLSVLNYAVNDTIILATIVSFEKQKRQALTTYFPIIKIASDTLHRAEKLKVDVNLPLPDSLVDISTLTFRCGFKPQHMKDSVLVDVYLEASLGTDKKLHLEIPPLIGPNIQLFYGYLYEGEKKLVHDYFETPIYIRN